MAEIGRGGGKGEDELASFKQMAWCFIQKGDLVSNKICFPQAMAEICQSRGSFAPGF